MATGAERTTNSLTKQLLAPVKQWMRENSKPAIVVSPLPVRCRSHNLKTRGHSKAQRDQEGRRNPSKTTTPQLVVHVAVSEASCMRNGLADRVRIPDATEDVHASIGGHTAFKLAPSR